MILTFWHPDFKKFAHPQGLAGASLSDLGPGSLSIGINIGIDWYSKYWTNIFNTFRDPYAYLTLPLSVMAFSGIQAIRQAKKEV